MLKVLKYSLYEMLRSRWNLIYFFFFFISTVALFNLSGSIDQVVISLLNIILILCPLITCMFAVMYFYNGKEFNQILLSQPLSRRSIFMGEYLGIGISLSLCLILGIGLPGLFYVITHANGFGHLFSLILIGSILTFVFTGIALAIAIHNENRIKGFSYTLFVWLILAVLYDGLFLLLLFYFKEYPLENFSVIASVLNPIDLSRISLMLNLESSALMGFTGAVFQKFFGSVQGLFISFGALAGWVVIPLFLYLRKATNRDF